MAEPSRGDRVIAFIHRYCLVPEGSLLGKPLVLQEFQKDFIRAVYDNPAGTSRAYLSIARKNGKTGLIACLLLAHLVGPEAHQNSRIVSGARTRNQAAEVYNYAAKMAMMSPALSKIIKPIPSQKTLIGLPMNVEYKAISADAKGAHGGSPILAILDEVGQIRGPHDSFVEAIETSQGAYEGKAILLAISTQASTDDDLFSRWLDDAATGADPRIVSRVHTAPPDCDLMDENAWRAANPALGVFRSISDVADFAARAARMPSDENSFRWLFLNQRIEASAPFMARAVWDACNSPPDDDWSGRPVFGGLDLSETLDLTALVLISQAPSGVWDVRSKFWLPGEGLFEKSKADRVPYDLWAKQGLLEAPSGTKSIEYDFVAAHLRQVCSDLDVRKIAFDRHNFKQLRPCLIREGFTEEEIEAKFMPFGQGFVSMSPALRTLEGIVVNGRMRHGGHPVLNMCAHQAVTKRDPAGNRKLDKSDPRRRIDGMVSLAMACAAAGEFIEEPSATSSPWDDPNFSITRLLQ